MTGGRSVPAAIAIARTIPDQVEAEAGVPAATLRGVMLLGERIRDAALTGQELRLVRSYFFGTYGIAPVDLPGLQGALRIWGPEEWQAWTSAAEAGLGARPGASRWFALFAKVWRAWLRFTGQSWRIWPAVVARAAGPLAADHWASPPPVDRGAS